MARTITITTAPQTIIEADQTRDGLEIINHGVGVVFVRHGGVIDLATDANCGVPLAPQASRAVTGPEARAAVSAAIADDGTAGQVLYFHEYFQAS